jgi:hypothetical protein
MSTFEVSARYGTNILEAFQALGEKMLMMNISVVGMRLQPNRHSRHLNEEETEETPIN